MLYQPIREVIVDRGFVREIELDVKDRWYLTLKNDW